MARKPFTRKFDFPKKAGPKKSKPEPGSVQQCQGDMCLNKLTRDWYWFQPAGMQIKLLFCAECVEHAMRQERQLYS